MNLFEPREDSSCGLPSAPLARRMCPRSLDEYVGQEHILGDGKLLRRCIESDRIASLILFGPPGTGKTALARVIASKTKASFERINAVTAGLDELRKIIRTAQARQAKGLRTIVFVDEIHRFNKLQQDALLPDVEEGTLTLIAATVENPFFTVNAALVSRSQVFELKPLSPEDIRTIIGNTLTDRERGLGDLAVKIDDDAVGHFCTMSDGDARRALTALEIACFTTQPGSSGRIHITLDIAEESIRKKAVVYDRKGDGHYDTISAFIKSMRGSDPNAAVYYLAKMLYAGEDPRFIARRILICASEDVGNADPTALVLSAAALRAVEFVGMPEARIPLAQAAIYVATAPKSNACYAAIDAAMRDIEKERTMEIPDHLKNAHYSGEKSLGRGVGYLYPHDFGGYVRQEYLKEKKNYYFPPEDS